MQQPAVVCNPSSVIPKTHFLGHRQANYRRLFWERWIFTVPPNLFFLILDFVFVFINIWTRANEHAPPIVLKPVQWNICRILLIATFIWHIVGIWRLRNIIKLLQALKFLNMRPYGEIFSKCFMGVSCVTILAQVLEFKISNNFFQDWKLTLLPTANESNNSQMANRRVKRSLIGARE